jgi:RNA ligase
MMYDFPVIFTINDVLPAIKDRKEFIVAEKKGYTVINYVVAMADTFDMSSAKDDHGAIRRECRGLIFDRMGNLISRPFHKFFNVNERPETQSNLIDLSKAKSIYDKVDGSMVRPFMVDGVMRWGTKMGVTEIGEMCERFVAEKMPEVNLFAHECLLAGYTPIFEYVGPYNRVVLEYPENIILLAVRSTLSGNYWTAEAIVNELGFSPTTIQCVKRFDFDKSKGIGELLNFIKPHEGIEGVVIDFGGHKVKSKAEPYLIIHKAKDVIRHDRNIANLILSEQIDDILPLLDTSDRNRVIDYQVELDNMTTNAVARIEALVEEAKREYGADRKRIALEFVPKMARKEDSALIFRALSGLEVRQMVLDRVLQASNNNTKYDEVVSWLVA